MRRYLKKLDYKWFGILVGKTLAVIVIIFTSIEKCFFFTSDRGFSVDGEVKHLQ